MRGDPVGWFLCWVFKLCVPLGFVVFLFAVSYGGRLECLLPFLFNNKALFMRSELSVPSSEMDILKLF